MSEFQTNTFFFDPGISVKEEPSNVQPDTIMSTSASVPIPTNRRLMEISDFRDFELEDNSPSPLYSIDQQTCDAFDTTAMWGNRLFVADDAALKSEALMHMDDEDDIFQVDKADLIQGPTLAELNANDDTYLGDLNFDDLLLPEEGTSSLLTTMTPKISSANHGTVPNSPSPFFINNNAFNHLNNNTSIVFSSSSCPQSSSMLFYRDLDLNSAVNSPISFSLVSKTTPPAPASPAAISTNNSPVHQAPKPATLPTLHDLLMRDSYASPERVVVTPVAANGGGKSPNLRLGRGSHSSRLSSSAPNQLGLADLWARREPRKHLLSTGSLAEAGSTSSISTGGVLSPDPQDYSHDEFDDSDDESDADHHYEDVSSDNDSDDDDHDPNRSSQSKKERYFWQYNVQAKGPKGQRLVMKCKMEDPHILNEITDPVFSPDCSVRGIKHSGKARKGDGNDLNPNVRKLYNIGKELDKLGRIINDMTPVSELPFNVRPKSRKEKNKLASRACRLKKKAQHEANKIKLSGLEVEHRNLLNGIGQSREIVMAKLHGASEKQEKLTNHLENIAKSATKVKVAGFTTDYVNRILDRLKKGQPLAFDES